MMRFKVTLLLGVIGLFSIVGCSQAPSSSNSGGAQSNSTSISATGSGSAQAGYTQLLMVLDKTQAAIDANDFAKAQQEFDRFESVWAPVEDGIKAKSDDAYDAIEDGMDQVSAALRSSQADKAIAAIQEMNDQIIALTPENLLASTQAGYPQLLSVLTKTRAAVEANDFATAQQEFDQFESVWAPVEDGIKAQSDDVYEAIEDGMDQVSAALRSSQADKAIAALQGMNDQIITLTPENSLTSTQAGYPQLLSVLTKTQSAVEANDFATAQQEFDQFESVWAPVEDGIKAKSDDAYDAIEDGMDQVSAALKYSQPDQAIAALQRMNKQIQSIPQG